MSNGDNILLNIINRIKNSTISNVIDSNIIELIMIVEKIGDVILVKAYAFSSVIKAFAVIV